MRIAHRFSTGLALLALAVAALPGRAAEAEKYLPGDSDLVLTVNVQVLLDSAIVKRNLDQLKPRLKEDANFQKTMDTLGLDPFKDVEHILISSPGMVDPDKVMVIVQGKFNLDKLHKAGEQAAKDKPEMVKIEKAGDFKVYQITPPNKGEKPVFAALLDETTLVGSRSRELISDAIDKKTGKKKSAVKKELADLLARADRKQSISVVATEAVVSQGELSGQAKNLTGGITITDDIKMKFVLEAKDDKTAKGLADAFDKQLMQVKPLVLGLAFQDKRMAPLVDVFNTFQVKADGANVVLTGEASKSIVEKIEKSLNK